LKFFEEGSTFHPVFKKIITADQIEKMKKIISKKMYRKIFLEKNKKIFKKII
jgi:hypothetical protein